MKDDMIEQEVELARMELGEAERRDLEEAVADTWGEPTIYD